MKKILLFLLLVVFCLQTLSVAVPKDFWFDRQTSPEARLTFEAEATLEVNVAKDKTKVIKIGDLPVAFSHKQHVKKHGLKCSSCHTKKIKHLFSKMKLGNAEFGMQQIIDNKYCGYCHKPKGKAFDAASPKNCAKCHRMKKITKDKEEK